MLLSRLVFWRSVLVVFVLSPPLLAGETTDLDEVLGEFDNEPEPDVVDEALAGFDEPGADKEALSTSAVTRTFWDYRGDISVSAAYNYAHPRPEADEPDHRGLSRLRFQYRPELWLDLFRAWDAKISASLFYDAAYQLAGRSQYPDQLLRHQESEAEFRDTYVRGKLSQSLDLKLGRQIIAWGKSDNLRVVDVLNPLDRREPGETDLEDLRLPLAMARADYYRANWSLTLVAIPEIRFDKVPVYGSAYYPAERPAPPEDTPGHGGSNTEYALAVHGVMTGWDVSFHLARIFDDSAHLAGSSGELRLEHGRQDMAGVAANMALGNWLLKGEAALLDGKQYLLAPGESFTRSDVLVGLEYSGFDNVNLSLETVVRHIQDYQSQLALSGVDRNTWQTAFRYSGDYWHERVNLLLLAIRWGESLEDGGFTRAQIGYEVQQAMELSLGAVLYHGGDGGPFASIADNDRIFLRLEYSF